MADFSAERPFAPGTALCLDLPPTRFASKLDTCRGRLAWERRVTAGDFMFVIWKGLDPNTLVEMVRI